MDQNDGASTLPVDALRRVFSFLDSRSTAICAAVCQSWHSVAEEDCLWQRHICYEFFRPGLLAYSAAYLGGCTQPESGCTAGTGGATAAAAASKILLHATQQGPEATAHHQPQPQHGLLKQLFSAGLVHAAAPHQALVARFHSALAQITAWRLLFKLNNLTAPATAASAASATAAATATANTSRDAGNVGSLSLNDGPGAGPSTHSTHSMAGTSATQGPIPDGVEIRDKCGNTSSSHTSGGGTRQQPSPAAPVAGHPCPLSMQTLQAGGWVVGCVLMQQQEQSCWVRFNLPPELRTDPDVAQALDEGHVAAVLQGLGPTGWFHMATADSFELSDAEMAILMQSHRTGFYAWDQRDEGGVDRYGQLEPLPWNLHPGQQQQPQQQLPQPPPPQQHAAAGVQQPQLAAGAAAAGGGEDEGNEAEPMHQLRMLAYVHYEQLLQVLPWQLPHALPLPAAPSFTSSEDCARHLLAGPCALWLQLDVCTLHGGHKLGSCIVPLRVWDCDAAQVQFRCIEEQLLVVLYDPDNSINRTQGFAGPEQIPLTATAAAAAAQLAACVAAAVCSSEAGSSEGGAGVTAGSAAAEAAAGGLRGVLGQEACRQVLLGVQCLYDAGSCGRDGGARTGAQALGRLMETDEIMVDFALFDARGHLLMGRAGIEVWSKQVSDDGYIDPGAQGTTAGTNTVGGQQRTASASSHPDLQQWQLLRHEHYCLRSAVEELARHIGPVVPRQGLDRLSAEQQRQAVATALKREQALSARRQAKEEAELACVASKLGDVQRATFARTVQKLHFLVDGVDGDFWSTGVTVDTQAPPPGFVPLLTPESKGGVSSVSMTLAMSNLRGLLRLPPLSIVE